MSRTILRSHRGEGREARGVAKKIMKMNLNGGVAPSGLVLTFVVAGLLMLLAATVPAAAAPVVAPPLRATASSGNTAWVLTATGLVLMMTLPGLALFYGGLIHARNVLSVLMHCFVISALVSVLWFAGAYSLVFTNGGALNLWIGSLNEAFLRGVGIASRHGTIPEAAFFMFQATFAIITPALIVGAFVERIRFSAVLLFSGLWLVLVYVPVCHWIWGGGWLAQLGVMDFAGGIVVHVTAGSAALTAALVVGKRRGFPNEISVPHSPVLTMIGAGLLWVGWYGFNAGSALAANGNAALALLVTHLSASAGALTWMTIEWIEHRKASLIGTVTGAIAGLAAITPASGFIGPAGALPIGIAAGIVCYAATALVKRRWRVDDSLDVFAVHGVGGALGSLLTGVFAAPVFGGLGFSVAHSIDQQVARQLLGIVVVGVWSAALSYFILKAIQAVGGLRVSRDEEAEGLDTSAHGERGYDLSLL